MTLNFGWLLFALSAEQVEMSTAMPDALRARRANMVKVLSMPTTLLTLHLFCSPLRYRKNSREPHERQPNGGGIESRNKSWLPKMIEETWPPPTYRFGGTSLDICLHVKY